VLSALSVEKSYKEDNWATDSVLYRILPRKEFGWKGADLQRGLEHVSRGIAIIRSRYQETSSEDTESWKNLECAVAICKLWNQR
jgi:hypothetical protein